MELSFELRPSQLKVFSAICSNLTVFWLVTLFTTRDVLTLTVNILFAMLSWYLAVKAEDILEEL